MLIRDFENRDREIFLTLCRDFYAADATLKPYSAENATATFNRVLEHHENLWGYLLTDRQNGEAAGYALVSAYWCNEEGGNILVLDELYLSPASRHHGYAGHFLEWLEKAFSGRARALTLEVLNTNQSAQSLYRHEGLSPDGFVTYTKNLS